MRRCNHRVPAARQSSQPSTEGGSSVTLTWSRWVQVAMRCLRSGLVAGQPDVEGGAVGSGVDAQRALVAVDHDPVRGGEPEAGAVPDLLGREERVEYMVADLGGDAGAVVGHVDARAAGLE